MGFYTYSATGKGQDLADNFISWLNSNGVVCSRSSSTSSKLDITDFNGLAASLSFGCLTNTVSRNYTFTLVTDPGKEFILAVGAGTATTVKNRYGSINWILNRDGELVEPATGSGGFNVLNIPWSGTEYEQVDFNVTGDNYIAPLWCSHYDAATNGWKNFHYPYLYFSINKVEVPVGVIISDGVKQFISCGAFMYMEYDPATMSG